MTYESNGFHAGVRKSCVAHKLWQTLHCILERVNGSCKVLLEGVHWGWGRAGDNNELMLSKSRTGGLSNLQLSCLWLRTEWWSYSLTMCPVVWKASSTMVSSWSEAAWWNTEKMFFQPDRILAAWEFTIWATHLITMSLMVGDLTGDLHEGVIITSVKQKLYNNI